MEMNRSGSYSGITGGVEGIAGSRIDSTGATETEGETQDPGAIRGGVGSDAKALKGKASLDSDLRETLDFIGHMLIDFTKFSGVVILTTLGVATLPLSVPLALILCSSRKKDGTEAEGAADRTPDKPVSEGEPEHAGVPPTADHLMSSTSSPGIMALPENDTDEPGNQVEGTPFDEPAQSLEPPANNLTVDGQPNGQTPAHGSEESFPTQAQRAAMDMLDAQFTGRGQAPAPKTGN